MEGRNEDCLVLSADPHPKKKPPPKHKCPFVFFGSCPNAPKNVADFRSTLSLTIGVSDQPSQEARTGPLFFASCQTVVVPETLGTDRLLLSGCNAQPSLSVPHTPPKSVISFQEPWKQESSSEEDVRGDRRSHQATKLPLQFHLPRGPALYELTFHLPALPAPLRPSHSNEHHCCWGGGRCWIGDSILGQEAGGLTSHGGLCYSLSVGF